MNKETANNTGNNGKTLSFDQTKTLDCLLPLRVVFTLRLYQSGWPDEAFQAYQSGNSALHLRQPACNGDHKTVKLMSKIIAVIIMWIF